MFCKNCGSMLEENSAFCGNCGTKVEVEETTVNNSNVNETNSANTLANNNAVNNTQGSSNNNMKNALIILLICLVVIGGAVFVYLKFFSSTAKSSAKRIESAMNNMNDIKNGTFKMNFDIKATSDGEEIEASLNASADIDIDKKIASLNMDISALGVSTSIPAYLDFNSSNAALYFNIPAALATNEYLPISAGWNKIALGDIFSDFEIEDNNKIIVIEDYAKTSDVIEKVDSNDKNIDNYKIHFTKELLEKLSQDEDNDFDISSLEGTGLENGFDADLSINKKDNYITKLGFDFSGIQTNGVSFDKFVFSFELTNLNKLDGVVIPSEALSAKELDLTNIGLPEGGTNLPEVDAYTEDYKLIEDGFTISYNLPKGYEASSVNDEDFKIYRKDGVRVIMTIDWDSKDEFFEEVLEEQQRYIKDGYTNVTSSEIKELSYKDKTFYYQVLEYTTTYGTKNYEVYLCYELDDEHVYSVKYEDEDHKGSITEDTMKDFLDITVN